MFTHYIDLDEIKEFKKMLPFFCHFRREDYIGDPSASIKKEVWRIVKQKGGVKLSGPVRMLTQIRVFGVCFNPVTFYYCFDKNDEYVVCILAEIENTPWGERHSYLIENTKQSSHLKRENFKKEFHISPFFDMDIKYKWLFSFTEDVISINMKSLKNKDIIFEVNMKLKEVPLTTKGLLKIHIKYPLITFKIIFGIYFQALILWLKGTEFYPHPQPSKQKKVFFFRKDKT